MLQPFPGGVHRIATVVPGLQGHQAPVRLLGVQVELDRTLQDRLSGGRRTGPLLQLRQAQERVERPAVEVLANWFGPQVVGALREVAAVELRPLPGELGVPLGRRRRGSPGSAPPGTPRRRN